MVRPVRQGPAESANQPHKAAPTQKASAHLETTKAAANNFVVKGRGRSALGAGSPPTISDHAPNSAAKVSKTFNERKK